MRKGAEPHLYSYVDYRAYLGDWFAARKAADSRYSHRLFARRADVSSPSLLKEVIEGRRNLTAKTLEGFLAALELTADQASFFTALVELAQASTEDERNDAWTKVAGSRRFLTARPIEGASMRYLSNWYYPAIRELALCDGFQEDPVWISKRVFPRIKTSEAKEALNTLFELGLLVHTPEGGVSVAEVSLATPHQLAGLGASNYHRQMLDRAKESVERAAPAKRHLLGVTVAVPRSLVPVLKRELDAMQERLLHLCDDAASSGAEDVFQLQLCLVPLTSGDPS